MADKKTPKVVEPVELPSRIHINEFLMAHTNLNDMQKAGLKVVAKKEWMRLDEWKEQLAKYMGE